MPLKLPKPLQTQKLNITQLAVCLVPPLDNLSVADSELFPDAVLPTGGRVLMFFIPGCEAQGFYAGIPKTRKVLMVL